MAPISFTFKGKVGVRNATTKTDATIRKFLNQTLAEMFGDLDSFIWQYGDKIAVCKNATGFYIVAY